MAVRQINYDRPTIIKLVPKTGMEVFMYKDNPGQYLTIHGNPVPMAIAAQAGYDVVALERKRLRLARIKAASALISQEDLEDAASGSRIVVADQEGFKVVNIGLGRHIVEDPDGNCITPTPLTKEVALSVHEGMVGQARADAQAAADVVSGLGSGRSVEPGPANRAPEAVVQAAPGKVK